MMSCASEQYQDWLQALKECMRPAGGNISSRRLDALADSGEISRKYRSK
jgi:hypothetical protein